MARRTFEDWYGDLRELVRDEMGTDLEECDFTEDDAREAFRLGLKPKAFLRNMGEEPEREDMAEIMREL